MVDESNSAEVAAGNPNVTVTTAYPDEKHAVAVLTNRRAAPVFQLASEIMDVIVERGAATTVE